MANDANAVVSTRSVITKDIWEDVLAVLAKHRIPYTTHYEHRDVQRAMEYPDVTVSDKHIQINLVIKDYFDDLVE